MCKATGPSDEFNAVVALFREKKHMLPDVARHKNANCPTRPSGRPDLPDYEMLGMLQRAHSTFFGEEKPWGALHAQIGMLQDYQHLIVW